MTVPLPANRPKVVSLDLRGRERLPDGGVLARLRRELLSGQPRSGLGVGGLPGLLDGPLRCLELLATPVDVVAQALELVVQAGLGLLRLRRWDERAGIELPVVAV